MNRTQVSRAGGLCLLLAVTTSMVAYVGPRVDPRTRVAGIEAPALAPPTRPCSVPGDRARAQAARAREEADARGARYGFDPRDGELAMGLFAEASACAASAGDTRDAASYGARADEWSTRLGADYRAHRVAMAVALERRDPAAVRRAAAWLRRLLSDRDGDYVAWLAEVERGARKDEP